MMNTERRTLRGRVPGLLARRAVPVYTAVLAAAGIAVGVVAHTRYPRSADASWPELVGFLLLMAGSASLLIRFHYGEQVMAIDLFETVLGASIVVHPVPVVMALAATALVVVETIHGNRRSKTAFNVAQWITASAAGGLAFAALGGRSGAGPRTMVALLGATAVVAVVNTLAFTLVIKLAERRRARNALAALAPTILVSYVVNATFAVMLVALYSWSHIALAVFGIMLLVLHGAHRAYSTAQAQRALLTGLHRAGRALSLPVDPREALTMFLEEARKTFDADLAEVLLQSEAGFERFEDGLDGPAHEANASSPMATALLITGASGHLTQRHPQAAVRAALRRGGWRECLAAVLPSADGPIGVLCIYNPSNTRGFSIGEESVVESLATEAAATLQKGVFLTAMLEERRKLGEIVAGASDGIFTLDPAGNVMTWNPGMSRITGYPEMDVEEKPLPAGLEVADDSGAAVKIGAWCSGAKLPPNIRIRSREGGSRWLSCSYAPLLGPAGEPKMLTVIARDRTNEHETERMRARLSESVAMLSHEIRAPLAPIQGWARTLLNMGEHADESMRSEGLRSILRQSQRLQRLVGNLLEHAKIERGLESKRFQRLFVKDLVAQAVEDLRITEPERVIELDAEPGLGEAVGDDLWVSQIVTNLLSNAVKYSPKSEPISVHVAARSGAVEVSVTDHGAGIDPSDLERIFHRYERLEDSITRSKSGAGLGLYLAKALATTMGGELEVESEPGRGSTFKLVLPRPWSRGNPKEVTPEQRARR